MSQKKKNVKEYNRIKEELEFQGKTQVWLASQIDCEFLTINRYANNARQPSIETLFEIAETLKVNPGDLLLKIKR